MTDPIIEEKDPMDALVDRLLEKLGPKLAERLSINQSHNPSSNDDYEDPSVPVDVTSLQSEVRAKDIYYLEKWKEDYSSLLKDSNTQLLYSRVKGPDGQDLMFEQRADAILYAKSSFAAKDSDFGINKKYNIATVKFYFS